MIRNATLPSRSRWRCASVTGRPGRSGGGWTLPTQALADLSNTRGRAPGQAVELFVSNPNPFRGATCKHVLGRAAKDKQVLRSANATQHDVQVEPPIIVAHGTRTGQKHEAFVDGHALSSLHRAHRLRSQGQLHALHVHLLETTHALVVDKVCVVFPSPGHGANDSHALSKSHVHLVAIESDKHRPGHVPEPHVTVAACNMPLVDKPVLQRILELQIVEEDVHHLANGILHQFVPSAELGGQAHALAHEDRKHAQPVAGVGHGHHLKGPIQLLWRDTRAHRYVYGLYVHEHLLGGARLAQRAVLHQAAHSLPGNGEFKNSTWRCEQALQTRVARAGDLPAPYHVPEVGRHSPTKLLRLTHELKEAGKPGARDRWILRAIYEPEGPRQHHDVRDALPENFQAVEVLEPRPRRGRHAQGHTCLCLEGRQLHEIARKDHQGDLAEPVTVLRVQVRIGTVTLPPCETHAVGGSAQKPGGDHRHLIEDHCRDVEPITAQGLCHATT